MEADRSICLAFGAALAALAAGPPGSDSEPNALTGEEKGAGWRLLFDGQTTRGWRRYKGSGMPESWKVVDGSLVSLPGPGESRGDIVTLDQFGDFELRFEWKMAPGGNSGVQYRVTEQMPNPWESGPEYQVLDNARHVDGKNPLSSAWPATRSTLPRGMPPGRSASGTRPGSW